MTSKLKHESYTIMIMAAGLLLFIMSGCGAQEKPVKMESNASSASVQSSSAPSADALYETEKSNFEKTVRNIPFKVKSSTLYLKNPDYQIDNETIEMYLDSKFMPALKKLLEVLPAGKKIVIEGYASATGPEGPSKRFAGNVQLSKNRAQAVIDYLNKKTGVDRDKLIIKYYGSKNTLPGIDPADERNCRVTMTILD